MILHGDRDGVELPVGAEQRQGGAERLRRHVAAAQHDAPLRQGAESRRELALVDQCDAALLDAYEVVREGERRFLRGEQG